VAFFIQLKRRQNGVARIQPMEAEMQISHLENNIDNPTFEEFHNLKGQHFNDLTKAEHWAKSKSEIDGSHREIFPYFQTRNSSQNGWEVITIF
jgi:hypothetical protein